MLWHPKTRFHRENPVYFFEVKGPDAVFCPGLKGFSRQVYKTVQGKGQARPVVRSIVGRSENTFSLMLVKDTLSQSNGFGVCVAIDACAGFPPGGVGIKRGQVEVCKGFRFYKLTGIIQGGKKYLAG